jgi:PTS system galactitol-specific IIA component
MSAAELELLSPDLVFLNVEANDAKDLLGQLEGELSSRGLIKGTWLDAILNREQRYPTGLSCPAIDVAIPHTDPENIEKPYIAVVKPAKPVEFEPMTGSGPNVQAQLIVNLGIVHSEGQVKILQLLMMTFMDSEKSERILAQQSSKDLYSVLMSCMKEVERSL